MTTGIQWSPLLRACLLAGTVASALGGALVYPPGQWPIQVYVQGQLISLSDM
jgi:uncharacterized protein (DUF2062 family)